VENTSAQSVSLFVQGSKYKNPVMLIDEDGILVDVQSRPMMQTVIINQPIRSSSPYESSSYVQNSVVRDSTRTIFKTLDTD